MFEILPYNNEMESRWDRFIMEESFNGTFLQTRKFLNYHPEGRFEDASFLVEKSGIIVAAVPGNTADATFVSHQGSTFGGPIISKDFTSASRMVEIVETIDNHLRSQYKSARLKITAQAFCCERNDLLEYVLEHHGYARHTELSCITPLDAGEDPLQKCKGECRRNFRSAEAHGLTYRAIEDSELELFYKFLVISKAKYKTHPVHTIEELRDLQQRFPGKLIFRGMWDKETYLSGIMLFAFDNPKVLHFQYLAPDESKNATNATTALFINVMREAAKNGYLRFSWGISTENGGNFLNTNLFRFKEAFGSEPATNVYFTKNF